MQPRFLVHIIVLAALVIARDAPAAAHDLRTLQHVSIGDVPVLISRPASISRNTRLIVLLHGFGPPENPDRLADAISLDGTPFIGAYVNMPMVAQRLPQGGVDELRRVQVNDFVNGLYFRSIAGAANELSSIVRYVEKNYRIDTSRGIGVFGFSAGGSAALLSLTESDAPIASVVVVNAPLSVRQNVAVWERELERRFEWDEKSQTAAKRFDVLAHAADIARRKPRPSILIMQGDRDEHLATQPATETAAALKAAYGRDGAMIESRVLPGVSHNFGPAAKQDGALVVSDGKRIRDDTLVWFEKHLAD